MGSVLAEILLTDLSVKSPVIIIMKERDIHVPSHPIAACQVKYDGI